MAEANKDNDEIDAKVKEEEKKNKEEHEEAEEDISAYEKFDYLRFTVADFHGIARSKSVSRRHFRSQLKDGITMFAGFLAAGTRCDIAPLDEVCSMNFGNCAVRPMPGTLRPLPWAANGKHRVGEVLCETFWMKPYGDGIPQEPCPRYMARRQLERLRGAGFQLYSTFEAEFMVFKRGTLIPIFEGMDVNSNIRMSELEEFVYGLDEMLAKVGVHTVTFQTEHGAGQFEFALEPSFGVEAVDRMFTFRNTVKELSLKQGYQATFMTQPFPEASNNGLHYNHSLWSVDSKRNLFSDQADPDGLSAVAKHWVAGIVKHLRAITALCCPTVNCYRRLFTPWAPDKTSWGIDDRFATVRVKAENSRATYVESRLPSGPANPYLVLAATVAAGLDGVVNGLECPPVRPNDPSATDLPRSLSEALKALTEDGVMVDALGRQFVEWFVKVKQELEVVPTDSLDGDSAERLEKERYFYLDML